ncbi:aldose 1-epimerase [Gregarina niphandrodes]|uniref:Aldose 1-epimerase n=1 Tax=Gregarina niphandrodes TaxID=110365 RepID=A0A023B3K3_GRENI|nr:aldose 1-epimerase [Gregarina niphandrodes]EZG55556.1 aldose 1-epimerase [Gregarina niphandrodes]|eukprot:XP_011131496.1 aldose 1-epimerase [Gregarina niphandrodes]
MESKLVASDGKTYINVIPSKCMISGFGSTDRADWEVLYVPHKTKNHERWGLPLMFPNFSSVANDTFTELGIHLPKHGLVTDKEWKEIARTDTSITVMFEDNEELLKQFPFKFRLEVTFEVKPKVCVHRYVIKNTGDKVLPCSPGIHPYFSVPQKEKTNVKINTKEFDCKSYNWENENPDDNIPFTGHLEIVVPTKGTINLREVSEPTKLFGRMQIWSEKSDAPDHEFICFEPVRLGANGLNNKEGRLNIEPGKQVEIVHEIEASF